MSRNELEHVYKTALECELRARGHVVGREVYALVVYQGEQIGRQRIDMIVDEETDSPNPLNPPDPGNPGLLMRTGQEIGRAKWSARFLDSEHDRPEIDRLQPLCSQLRVEPR